MDDKEKITKKPFSEGQRVVVYNDGEREFGRVDLTMTTSPNKVCVWTTGNDGNEYWKHYHTKQLRRLIPRKRREWTLRGGMSFSTAQNTTNVEIRVAGPALAPGETVVVVEKKVKGKK